ncbi:hypothetical protein Landi51_09924 [Colletotrichum acutatum]
MPTRSKPGVNRYLKEPTLLFNSGHICDLVAAIRASTTVNRYSQLGVAVLNEHAAETRSASMIMANRDLSAKYTYVFDRRRRRLNPASSEFATAFAILLSRARYQINFACDVDATSSFRDESLDTNFTLQNGWSKYPLNRNSPPGHGCQSDISQMDSKLGIADPLQRYPMPFPTLVLDQTTPDRVSLPRPNETSQGIWAELSLGRIRRSPTFLIDGGSGRDAKQGHALPRNHSGAHSVHDPGFVRRPMWRQDGCPYEYRLLACPPQNVSFQSEMGVGAPRICSATDTTPPWPPRLTVHREGKFCRESTYLCTDSKQDGMPAITPHHPLWATQPQLRLASLRAVSSKPHPPCLSTTYGCRWSSGLILSSRFSITLAFLPVPSLPSVSECRPRGVTWNVAIAKN